MDIEAYIREIPRLVMGDKSANKLKSTLVQLIDGQHGLNLMVLSHFHLSGCSCYICCIFDAATQSIAAINSAIYGLKWAHSKVGRDSPTDDIMVKQLVESASRILSKPRKPKEPLMPYEMKQMVSSVRKGDL